MVQGLHPHALPQLMDDFKKRIESLPQECEPENCSKEFLFNPHNNLALESSHQAGELRFFQSAGDWIQETIAQFRDGIRESINSEGYVLEFGVTLSLTEQFFPPAHFLLTLSMGLSVVDELKPQLALATQGNQMLMADVWERR